MKSQLLFILLCLTMNSMAQITISGTVKNEQGEALPGVNIYIENSYDGISTDENGKFAFKTNEPKTNRLIASFIGYQQWTSTIAKISNDSLHIELKENVNSLDAVTIIAGSFAASDQKRASVLDPIDIYTIAGSNGDIMAAMRTMPGTQASPDDGQLMVRGGDVSESKTYIDGLLSAQPYQSKTPDIATRGRFSPSLFPGVQFNSGGYSAEYGQALSSILELNTSDIATSDATGISLMTIGAEANITKASPKHSIMTSGGYTNMGIYQKVLKTNLQWTRPIESFNFNSIYRYKPTSSGLFKAFINGDYSHLGYQTYEGNGIPFDYKNKGGNIYSNVNYRDCLTENTCYKIGIATTYNSDLTHYNNTKIDTRELSIESRASLTHYFREGIQLKLGMSESYSQYHQDISGIVADPLFKARLNDHLIGIFAESEIRFNKYIAIRPGVRGEYSTLLNETNIAPRLALAVKTGKKSQISAAWGQYYQTPKMDVLKYNSDLTSENATHYILCFQKGDASKRLFRTEVYSKKYSKLSTWEGNNPYRPQNIKNEGRGYANGIDIFWKDQKSVKNLEYWATYSYIDTKRMYLNYPYSAQPNYISKHTFSMVTKYWVHKISTQFGTSFTLASPRNFDDPNTNDFMEIKTQWYNNLSINMSHIFFISDHYSVFYVSLSNVLGYDNILGYRSSTTTNAGGQYALTPIKNERKHFLFIGLFLNF